MILKGDGTWKFSAEVCGDDIVVTNVRATCFGGDGDSMDSGATASGFPTRGNSRLAACALPMALPVLPSLKGSPIPRVPWLTVVEVTSAGIRAWFPVIDLGPGKRTGNALDLTIAAARVFDAKATANDFSMMCDYRILRGAVLAGLV